MFSGICSGGPLSGQLLTHDQNEYTIINDGQLTGVYRFIDRMSNPYWLWFVNTAS